MIATKSVEQTVRAWRGGTAVIVAGWVRLGRACLLACLLLSLLALPASARQRGGSDKGSKKTSSGKSKSDSKRSSKKSGDDEASDDGDASAKPSKKKSVVKKKADDAMDADEADQKPAAKAKAKAAGDEEEPKTADEKAAKKEAAGKSKVRPPSLPSEIEALLTEPTTTEEMWQVLDRDLAYGLDKQAEQHLKQLLAQPDLKEKILDLREKYGSAMLVRLQNHPDLRSAGQSLVDMANDAARARARDEQRIRHFIDNLVKSPEERAYALQQLRISGIHAFPVLIDALQHKQIDRGALISTLFAMPRECWPAAAAALDSGDEDLIGLMVDLLRHWDVRKAVDSLWYPAGAPKLSEGLRVHTSRAINDLLGLSGSLPSPVLMLTRVAQRYYDHQSGFGTTPATVPIWRWENGALHAVSATISEAEEFYGTKAARQALAIDPNYEPAQALLLSLALDKAYEKVGQDRPLPPAVNGVVETALSTGPRLLTDVLTKAIRERRTAVVLGAITALGQTGKANLLTGTPDRPAPVVQALNYPNPRVQFAAALATLEIHPQDYFQQAPRVVDTLTRALAPETRLQALVMDGNAGRGHDLESQLLQLGYQTQWAGSGRAGFTAAAQSSNIDLVVIEPRIQNWGLDETVANFRADARTAGVPIVLLARDDIRDRLDSLAHRYFNVYVVGRYNTKESFARALALELDPTTKPLTPAEKAINQRTALGWVLRLARGELPSFDIRPAADALTLLLPAPELGPTAAEALAFVPGAKTQARLAGIALSDAHSLPNRLAAADALARNIQLSGRGLDRPTAQKVLDLFEKSQDERMRIALARVAGGFGPTNPELAKRLERYRTMTPPEVKAPVETKPEEKPDLEPKPETKEGVQKGRPTKAEKANDGKSKKEAPSKKKSFFDDQ